MQSVSPGTFCICGVMSQIMANTLVDCGLEEHFRLGGICVVVSMYDDY